MKAREKNEARRKASKALRRRRKEGGRERDRVRVRKGNERKERE